MRRRRALVLVGSLAATVGLSACGGEPRRAAIRELTVPSVTEPADTAQMTDPRRAHYIERVDEPILERSPAL